MIFKDFSKNIQIIQLKFEIVLAIKTGTYMPK